MSDHHQLAFILLSSCLLDCGGEATDGSPKERDTSNEDDKHHVVPDDDVTLELEGEALSQVVTGERLCGLDEIGRVLCEGGGPPFDKPATKLVSASPNHREDLLCMLLEGGEALCTYPYYSTNFTDYHAIDLSLSDQTALIVTTEGEIVGSWGQYLKDKYYRKATAGVGFGCGINSSGGLSCFGFVEEAEIRQAPHGSYSIVFEVPDGHFRAIYANSLSAYAPFCGVNEVGQATCWWLRNSEERPFSLNDAEDIRAVEAFSPDSKFLDLAIGYHETCGIVEMKRVVCWEHTDAGDPPPTLKTPMEVDAVSIAVGTNGVDFCILDESGMPHCWES